MKRSGRGFTLIELIIVIVIVGILAMVAIPRYFANVHKARRAEAYSTLRSIREALMGYHAVWNSYPAADTFPVTVTVDGETVLVMDRPASANFSYTYGATAVMATTSAAASDTSYTLTLSTGGISPTT